MLAQVRGALDDVDLATDELCRACKLFFKVDPVVYQDDLEVFEIRRGPEHPCHKNHSQRFAGTLGMPDDTGASLGRSSIANAIDDLAARHGIVGSGQSPLCGDQSRCP